MYVVINSNKELTYQIVKDVSLVKVNGDKCFILDSVYLVQFLRRHFNERVQNVKKVLISSTHDFLVCASILESNGSISCPYNLKPQQTNLKNMYMHM